MFGGSSKLGRGGGRGGGGGGAPRNRNSFPPPPHRNPAAVGRTSTGGGSSSVPRHRSTTSVKAGTSASASDAAPRAVEETFSLVPGKSPPAFAMIIRLAPDLVDEIRRLETQGGNAKIKFDALSNNTSGNIIDVGGKEFKFTWSRELGDLCDIYEECQSGEDGNGVLVEAGCAWRKLNVQRTLDESTTNHVKMRSVEAEQRTKSRKTIVLDPGNPSLTKQLARDEASRSPWRKYNPQKKEPPLKKRKVDPPQVPIGGPKPAIKTGLATPAAAKGRLSASPAPSPDQFNASPSIGMGNLSKSHVTNEDVILVQSKSKDNIVGTQKDSTTCVDNTSRGTSGHKTNNADKSIDLQSLLINLLKDAPMSLKALEKAVGDKIPNATKNMEPILKKIANLQAPGKYFLKPGLQFESFKKHSPGSGSSPEDNHQMLPLAEHRHDQVPVPGANSIENISVCEPSGKSQEDCATVHSREQTNVPENVDIEQQSTDIRGEENASENRENQACTSSDTGSDSDSDSDNSDSGSDSGSHSKSPAGSESGSSSDSEASSNSKEGSDEDVNIMSDDDREPRLYMPPSTELGLPVSATPCQTDGNRIAHDGSSEKQEGDGSRPVGVAGHGSDADDVVGHYTNAVDIEGNDSDAIDVDRHGSDAVDIEGRSSDEGHGFPTVAIVDASPVANKGGNSGQEHFSSDHDKLRECQNLIGRLFDDMDNIGKDSFNNEQSDGSQRLVRGRSKRASDLGYFNQKTERAKRLKAEGFSQSPSLGGDSRVSENMHEPSPKKRDEGRYRASASQMTGPANRDLDANHDLHTGPTKALTGNSNLDLQPSCSRIPQSTPTKPVDGPGRLSKHADASGNVQISAERDVFAHEILPSQTGRKTSKDKRRDANNAKEKKFPKNKRDGNMVSKHAYPSDVLNKKHDELAGDAGNVKDARNVSGFGFGSSPIDNQRTSLENFRPKGNGSMLQREVSDLELGELREPLAEDTAVEELEERSSFKQQDNKTNTSENCVSDLDKRKPFRKSNFDSKRSAPPNTSNGVKGLLEHDVEELAGSHNRVLQSHVQYQLAADNTEIGTQHSKSEDGNGKSRPNDVGARLESGVEGYGETQKKASIIPQHSAKRGSGSHSLKVSKRNTSSVVANLTNGQNGGSLTLGDTIGRKKRETSFDEEDSSYLKYEKASPELKGPINDLSQYKAYMQDYQEKYGTYYSLHKILESYRNEFQKLGEDLEFTRGRDMERYNKILHQLKESYQKSGERHKRLKKIFILLHEELKNCKQRMKEYASSHGKD